jgi:2-polyprenyl-3-methyl-5-hydroxy-6-metoxy-1,4-benzoquinol methylase
MSNLHYLQKLEYFLVSFKKNITRSGFSCPSCAHKKSFVLDRKYLFTTLRRCTKCRLLFRAPTISPEDSISFYRLKYSDGFATDLPSTKALNIFMKTNFKGSEKDFSYYISVLRSLGCEKGDSLLDFGCSWGYGSFQLKEAGYKVKSFEISESRCNYAKEKLGLEAYSEISKLKGPFDIFFSSHVLEHVPSVSKTIDYAWEVLRPGGLFVAFAPNGSKLFKKNNYNAWHKAWGLVHPTFIDDEYYKNTFSVLPILIASSPYPLDMIAEWSQFQDTLILDLSGGELLFAIRKPKS